MPPNKKNLVQHDETLVPQVETAKASAGDMLATSDLYSTIKNGTAKVENLKLLIPGFEILIELGRGAFGVVYQARDEKLDRQVAIKISLLDDPALREIYIKEAKSAAKLDHPGIVPVYQVGTLAGGQPFVVQRMIDGTTLRKVLANTGPLTLHHACWLMSEIARAVAEAHKVGMIHRDLKPDNILVDSTGKPWVADFGLAILEEDQREHRGEKAGTPLYMSPEQLKGRADWLDGRADIYALGIMLYEMLVGRTPFDARNLAELEEQVLHRDPKPMSQRSPNIPAVMDIIFQNCCAKKVNDRYSNAYELVEDLESVMAEIPETDPQAAAQNKPYTAGGVGARKSSHRVGITTRRKTLRSTIREEPKTSVARRLVLPLLTLVGLLAGGTYMFWPNGSKANLVPNQLSLSNKGPGQAEIAAQTWEIPGPPWRVSQVGKRTHTSIQAALERAEENETITILPGVYEESILIDKNITLIGEGARANIVIHGQSAPALRMKGNVSVSLKNLTIRADISGDQGNTIDVVGGTLAMSDCTVSSTSYDCVKVWPSSALNATKCNFRSTAHPAITATEAKVLDVLDCEFDISPQTLDGKSIPVGIQAENSPAVIENSVFNGKGATGIHCIRSKSLITIKDPTFVDCEHGIIVQDCTNVQIHGTTQRDKIGWQGDMIGCSNGILLQGSGAVINGLKMKSGEANIGIRVLDSRPLAEQPSVKITGCEVEGFNISLSVEHTHVSIEEFHSLKSAKIGIQVAKQAKLEMKTCSVTQSASRGMLIEDSLASMTNCHVDQNSGPGITVDGVGNSLNSINSTMDRNVLGLLIYSGAAEIHGGSIANNSAGLVLTSRKELGLPSNPDREDDPVYVDLEDVTFDMNDINAMQVLAPCVFRIAGGKFSDLKNADKPKIKDGLKAVRNGEVTNVLVVSP